MKEQKKEVRYKGCVDKTKNLLFECGCRCFFSWVFISIGLLGLSYLIFYLLIHGSLNCSVVVLDSGTVQIQDACTVVRQPSNEPSNRQRRKLQTRHRRLSFADVARSVEGWNNPPLSYWEGSADTTGSFSIFANQLPDQYLETQMQVCQISGPVEGCDFYYEDIIANKVVDIKNFQNISMRTNMVNTMYNFDQFYWESGSNCENKVIDYDSSNFRHRFECGAKSFNDGNRFLNIYEIDLIQRGDIGIFTLPGGFMCPGGVRVFDVNVYPVIYIEMIAHLYNIFIGLSNDTNTAIKVAYNYTPRSIDQMRSTSYLPCMTRESVVDAVQRIADQNSNPI